MKKEATLLWHDKFDTWLSKEEIIYEGEKSELVIESLHSFISLGTEKTMIKGGLSLAQAKRMAVPFMKGSLNDTFTYGYSSVGRVIEGNPGMVGQYVHLLHPHQDIFIVGQEHVFQIPDGIDLKEATLASNLETVVNALWDAAPEVGDKVQIIGYGTIGALIAKLIKQIPGVQLVIHEVDQERIALAEKHGHNVVTRLSKDYDLIYNTSSGKGSLQEALTYSKMEATIVELSWYGSEPTLLELGADFHYGRKKIISSQVSSIPFRKQPQWNFTNRKELVFRLLNELDFSDLITHEIEYTEAPEFYKAVRSGEINSFGTIINYNL